MAKLALSATSTRITPSDISGTVAFQKELEMAELTNALTAGQCRGGGPALAAPDDSLIRGASTGCSPGLRSGWSGVQKGLRMKKQGRGNLDICQEARIWKARAEGAVHPYDREAGQKRDREGSGATCRGGVPEQDRCRRRGRERRAIHPVAAAEVRHIFAPAARSAMLGGFHADCRKAH